MKDLKNIRQNLDVAIEFLDLIEDSIESVAYIDIYRDGMELLYEFQYDLNEYMANDK